MPITLAFFKLHGHHDCSFGARAYCTAPLSPFSSWPPLPFFIGVAINFLHSLIASHMIWSTSACNQGWACYCLPLRTGGYRLLAFLLRFSFNTPFPGTPLCTHRMLLHGTLVPLQPPFVLASPLLPWREVFSHDSLTATARQPRFILRFAWRLASFFVLFFVLGFSPQQGISTADFAVMFVV